MMDGMDPVAWIVLVFPWLCLLGLILNPPDHDQR